MVRKSLQGGSVRGAMLASRLKCGRIFGRQRGAGTLEYMLISGFMLGALLTPFGQDDENALQRLLNAIRGQQDAYNYSAKLPVMPSFDADGNIIGMDSPGPDDGNDGAEPPSPPTDNIDNDGTNEAGDGAEEEGGQASDNEDEVDHDSDFGSGSSNGDAGNGGEEGQDASSGGEDSDGSTGGLRPELEELVVELSIAAAGGYASWEFTNAVGSFLCGQLDLQDAKPHWTQEDIWAHQAADEVYDIGYEASKESFSEIGVEYIPEQGLGGFSAALIKKGDTWLLTFRGSDEFADGWLKNNFPQPVLGAAQYDLAVAIAEDVKRKLDGQNFLIAGHSLGGGLAQAAAYATGMDAITFNAAGLNGRYKEDEGGGGPLRRAACVTIMSTGSS